MSQDLKLGAADEQRIALFFAATWNRHGRTKFCLTLFVPGESVEATFKNVDCASVPSGCTSELTKISNAPKRYRRSRISIPAPRRQLSLWKPVEPSASVFPASAAKHVEHPDRGEFAFR